MFNKILIANRGEIAVRILRTCRDLGIETVAVYSQADEDALYLRQADDTICIGPGVGSKSYLHIPSIISAAEIADVEAIHPGYGFLSENADFAEKTRAAGIAWVGPSPAAITQMGDKIAEMTLKQAKELSDYLKDAHGIEPASCACRKWGFSHRRWGRKQHHGRQCRCRRLFRG